ncbi:hypothetical protein AYI70_g4557 [Smittium culicis]|uniref:Uncharacterized protein n=1 Tax=Smittium culicis TaxID=133412 RepID=A0A1R1XYG2_9FUNG|nr:hypothetical protein AYI70_g7564 [Smittium culicis]OMJ19713.1 hypothetical protein AYI70_g4557 [Smittium culicis]
MSFDVERTKNLASQLRRQLFVGVEDDPQTNALLKSAGSNAKKERLLNLVEVREGDPSDNKAEMKAWILCLTGKYFIFILYFIFCTKQKKRISSPKLIVTSQF